MKKMQYTLPVSLSAVAYAAVRSRQSIRCSSTGSIWRDANPNSPRASPYPLVFIRTPENWGEDAKEWQSTQGLLIEKGFGCLEIFCDEHKGSTSKEILKKMADGGFLIAQLAVILSDVNFRCTATDKASCYSLPTCAIRKGNGYAHR